MHNAGFMHKDVKLENMMITKDCQVKLIDFGLSSVLGTHKDRKGDNRYWPPEKRMDEDYDGAAADVFALGVCLFGLRMTALPFGNALLKTALDGTKGDINYYRL